MNSNNEKALLTEDWTVVVFGFLIIILTLIGFKIPTPAFGWENSYQLLEKVLTVDNLINIGSIFLVVYLSALLAAKVLGKGFFRHAQRFSGGFSFYAICSHFGRKHLP